MNAPDLTFERHDWELFTSLDTIGQKAGVSLSKLRRLVIKELVDNGLDAGAIVEIGQMVDGSYWVQDDGPGIEPESVARLFSINRPLVSSKLWRLPTRGALGNGLRVVAGAVLASDGFLRIYTRNQLLHVKPCRNGTSTVIAEPIDHLVGTRIEIGFGQGLPHSNNDLQWGAEAIAMSEGGPQYLGKSSPHWYDGEAFRILLWAAGERPVRDLVAHLDGCTSGRAGEVTGDLKGRACASVDRVEAARLLSRAKAKSKDVTAARLGYVGALDCLPPSYARVVDLVSLGPDVPQARVPFVVEAWAHAEAGEDFDARVFVNRTPITGDVVGYLHKKEAHLKGCGLNQWFGLGKADYDVVINVITPFMPITTDGKEPDLSRFRHAIRDATTKACRKSKRLIKGQATGTESQKDIILDNLLESAAKASGDGRYRFNQRQLFYVVRPIIIAELAVEPTYQNFCTVIGDYETEHGEITGMFRDPRGLLYHPHMNEEIPLGTLDVEKYRRPDWQFNKVAFIEKAGFFETLKADRWPERHDCMLMTSKGYATRAAKDLLDLLGDHPEPVTVYCVHDADAAGSMIFQTLQEETKARPRRSVEIVNIGLEPWEIGDLGLECERVQRKSEVAVADYVKAFDQKQGTEWAKWLQSNRCELNAMTSPQFIAWLDSKIEASGVGKLIPPGDVLVDHAEDVTRTHLRQMITDRILREAKIDERVDAAFERLDLPTVEDLQEEIETTFEKRSDTSWRTAVDCMALALAIGAEEEAP